MNNRPIATVFGGTGFLGRRVVQALTGAGYEVRVAARHPGASRVGTHPVTVDVRDEEAVRHAVTGAQCVVNAVSLFVEKGDLTFEAIHVKAAERLARLAKEAGTSHFVHVSGIGVEADSPSAFVRARALGEHAVRQVFPEAIIVRPSVMFGRDDAFITGLVQATLMPVVPLFGDGSTRMQPAYVEDVAKAVAKLVSQPDAHGRVYELGGAKVYTYRQAVQAVMAQLRRKRLLLPMPFGLWHALVTPLQMLPNPALTPDQLYLLQTDNTVGSNERTFVDVGMAPESFESALPQSLAHA